MTDAPSVHELFADAVRAAIASAELIDADPSDLFKAALAK